METTIIRPCTVAEFFDAPNAGVILAEYAVESAIEGLPPPAASREIYEAIEATGALRVIGAFDGEEVVGCLVLVVSVNPHYGIPLAVAESFFVSPEWRKTGAGMLMLQLAEDVARSMGAEGIFVSAPTDSRLAQVMNGIGFYRETTRAFFRRLA